MTDWGSHGLDMLQWCLNMDHGGPEEVWVEGAPYVPIVSTPENPGSRRGGPQAPIVFMKFPGDIIMEFNGGHMSGGTFIGENGSISVGRGGFNSNPSELLRQPVENAEDEPYRGMEYALRTDHRANWIQCIKDRSAPIAPAEAGHRAATLCHLGNIARWVSGITGETGQRLKWDARQERFTNSDEANVFLAAQSRGAYKIPEKI